VSGYNYRSIKHLPGKKSLVFLAHPYSNYLSPTRVAKKLGYQPDKVIKDLLDDYDFDGLEINHPDHTPDQSAQLFALAQARELLISGGSDSHFFPTKNFFGLQGIQLQPWMEELQISSL